MATFPLLYNTPLWRLYFAHYSFYLLIPYPMLPPFLVPLVTSTLFSISVVCFCFVISVPIV